MKPRLNSPIKIVLSVVLIAGLMVVFKTSPVFSQFLPKKAPQVLREAMYYVKMVGNAVGCRLCPRKCTIPEGKRGFCGVRENRGGTLYTLVYGQPCAVHLDPIEKKPFFHFLPGTGAFSIATAGCNIRCKFCQNWEISQVKPEEVKPIPLSPAEVVAKAKEYGAKTIAYTYTEPTIFYEYMLETAKLARAAGIKNVMHSCGYINPEPLIALCPYLDAANIDLKGIRPEYYRDVCFAELEPVLASLKILKAQGVWVEVTNLIVPTLNDRPEDFRELAAWVKANLGPDTPLHFSRFYPQYKLINLSPTPVSKLEEARKIAQEAGLKYVYIGNVPGHEGETTACPRCQKRLLERVGYQILSNNIESGKCKFCGAEIAGVWK